MGPERFGSKEVGSKKISLKKFESKRIWRKRNRSKKIFGPKKLDPKYFLVPRTYLKSLVKIGLGYSIRFKLRQRLHGQMFTGQMFSRQLTTHTDGLIIEFG